MHKCVFVSGGTKNSGLGIEINEEECLKHPYQVHTLRHYTGALTDIRPAKSEFYF